VLLQQFNSPANPDIHLRTAGPEIWEDIEGPVDVLVSESAPAEPSQECRAISDASVASVIDLAAPDLSALAN
jgi:hypothetical protein